MNILPKATFKRITGSKRLYSIKFETNTNFAANSILIFLQVISIGSQIS